jgi:hypothetical protein
VILKFYERRDSARVTSGRIAYATMGAKERVNEPEGHLQSQLTCFWKEPGAAKGYRAAVSLHGHTNHSKERLSFIGDYAARNPILRAALATQERDAMVKSAITVDFAKAYWTPPLSPLAAFQLERDQIKRVLGLASMVSLTDHDTIAAPMRLRVVPEARSIPVSVEWSVPYSDTTLHIGVHNLPSGRAEAIMAQLAEHTKNPEEQQLSELLKMLHEMPDVLIVLNHPMWDLSGIGKQRHAYTLSDFIAKLGMFIHAFELGGLRSWEENRAVLNLAERWNQIAIGGGDRHGAEPSAVLNLTNAESFPEFVREVRGERRCHVLFMPQYAQPFVLRMLQSLLDVIREYPDYPESSRRWDERVFHPDRHGDLRPLATLWDAPPPFINIFFATVRMLEVDAVRQTIQAALAKPEREMHFALDRGLEARSQWKKIYGSRSFQIPTTKSTGWRTRAGSLRRSRESADSPS